MWVHNIWKHYEILFLLNDIAYNDIAYYSMKEEVGFTTLYFLMPKRDGLRQD